MNIVYTHRKYDKIVYFEKFSTIVRARDPVINHSPESLVVCEVIFVGMNATADERKNQDDFVIKLNWYF